MQSDPASSAAAQAGLAKRSVILFLNFFLIILAYYQVKSASRSLLIEYWGSDNFPYVWIFSALVLGSLIGFYNRMVERYSRLNVVLGCILLFIGVLIVFRLALQTGSAAAAVAFYIFIDVFSVILVEQFWSLANTVTEAEGGKKSYWFVGTGGLLGGALGGGLAALLLEVTPMRTPDLLLSCAALLGVTLLLNLAMGRTGFFEEVKTKGKPVVEEGGWKILFRNRYILLIAASLLCAQLAQPVVEYQFIKTIEATYEGLDERTQFISSFFGVLGIVSIAVNLVVTPIVHRYLGIFAGLAVQPFILSVAAFGFMLQPTLMVASVMKIADRGLSYSIARASKEQLYIPVDPVQTYQAKAWIDMLGYRLFKVLGAALILLLVQWLPVGLTAPQMSWLTLAICAAWFLVIAMLSREYNAFALKPAMA
ncbi:MAG: Npt1/Npt2 family nucleotide transporter [Alphaproteobacteria bacterium]|nr:Npt1/Npt2 family nucleotide transporter [Alphaproteobacteria bacterium]